MADMSHKLRIYLRINDDDMQYIHYEGYNCSLLSYEQIEAAHNNIFNNLERAFGKKHYAIKKSFEEFNFAMARRDRDFEHKLSLRLLDNINCILKCKDYFPEFKIQDYDGSDPKLRLKVSTVIGCTLSFLLLLSVEFNPDQRWQYVNQFNKTLLDTIGVKSIITSQPWPHTMSADILATLFQVTFFIDECKSSYSPSPDQWFIMTNLMSSTSQFEENITAITKIGRTYVLFFFEKLDSWHKSFGHCRVMLDIFFKASLIVYDEIKTADPFSFIACFIHIFSTLKKNGFLKKYVREYVRTTPGARNPFFKRLLRFPVHYLSDINGKVEEDMVCVIEEIFYAFHGLFEILYDSPFVEIYQKEETMHEMVCDNVTQIYIILLDMRKKDVTVPIQDVITTLDNFLKRLKNRMPDCNLFIPFLEQSSLFARFVSDASKVGITLGEPWGFSLTSE